jgi:hypothetical protein
VIRTWIGLWPTHVAAALVVAAGVVAVRPTTRPPARSEPPARSAPPPRRVLPDDADPPPRGWDLPERDQRCKVTVVIDRNGVPLGAKATGCGPVLDAAPRLTARGEYNPSAAHRRHQRCKVTVVIDRDGVPTDADATGCGPVFADAAEAALRRWWRSDPLPNAEGGQTIPVTFRWDDE